MPTGGPYKYRFFTQDFLLVGVLLSGHAARDVLRLAEHLWAPEVPSHYTGRTPGSLPDVGWKYSPLWPRASPADPTPATGKLGGVGWPLNQNHWVT